MPHTKNYSISEVHFNTMICNSLSDPVCIQTIAMMEDEWIITKNTAGMTLERKKYKACRETPLSTMALLTEHKDNDQVKMA